MLEPKFATTDVAGPILVTVLGPQYNYVCSVHVRAEPIFREAASSLCP